MKQDIKIEYTDTFLKYFFQLVKFFFYSNFFFPDSESSSKTILSHSVPKKVDFFEFFTFSTPLAHAHAPGIHGYWYQIFHSLASATVV